MYKNKKNKHPWQRRSRSRSRPQRVIEWQCPKDDLACASGQVFAAIDLGTNNCRLLVAKLTRDGLEIIDSWSRITRLGEGLVQTGRLNDGAMERTIDALAVCAGRMQHHGVMESRSVATEACRRAENGAEFACRVKEETGLDLDIIDCQEEAAYAVRGCDSLVCPDKDLALIFDIGGGSSELTLIRRNGDDFGIDSVISLPLGVVTMFESHAEDNDEAGMIAAIQRDVAGFLEKWPHTAKLAEPARNGRLQLIGTSGTITTMAALHLDLPRYQRHHVDGSVVPVDGMNRVRDQLITMKLHERAAHPCIGEGRADLVLPGAAIVDAIIDALPATEITVADRGIREGILIGLANSCLQAGKAVGETA